MNKHEAAWLSLRVTGLVVALVGLKQFSMLLYLISMFFSGQMRDMKTNITAQVAFTTTVPPTLGGAIILAVAAYLLFGGRKLHSILMTEK